MEKLSRAGQFQVAFDYHMTVIDAEELSISPYIRWLEFSCILQDIEPPQDEILRRQSGQAPHDYGAIFSLNNLVFGILEGRCPNAPLGKIQLVLSELTANENFSVSQADLLFYSALLAASAEDFSAAAALATESFSLRSDARVALYQINWLIRSDRLAEAATLLQALGQEYDREISASVVLANRYQFLSDRLQTLSN